METSLIFTKECGCTWLYEVKIYGSYKAILHPCLVHLGLGVDPMMLYSLSQEEWDEAVDKYNQFKEKQV
jgi:hypothetical protein